MFMIFLDRIDEVALDANGFTKVISDTESSPTDHLRNRNKPTTSLKDIYEIGLSIHENEVVQGLSKTS